YASIKAWQDEQHVVENRRLYREKFAAFIAILADACVIQKPSASFYIWLKIPQPSASPSDKGGVRGISDTDFARQLFARENITVLPGSFLSREFDGINPGINHVRIALVAPLNDCIEAAHRIKHFLNTL
ncbi:MAG: succinyldiaminopimelate transaminase, partial [Methylococcaceae bacterium]